MGSSSVWTVAVFSLVLLATLAVAIGGNSGAELGDYRALLRAMDGLPGTIAEVEALAQREDGVGYQACLSAGRAHREIGNYSLAADFFLAALSLYPTRDVRLEAARALSQAGRDAEAREQWTLLLPWAEAVEAVRQLEPDPIRVASLLRKSGLYAEALASLGDSTRPQAHLERARALVGLGRAKESLPEFRAYLAATPGDKAVQVEYGRALEKAGDLASALAAYRAAGAAGAIYAGQLLLTLGRREEAIQAYLSSTDPECRWRAARLLEEGGQEAKALPIYIELAQGSSRVSDDAALRAYVIYMRRGDDLLSAATPLPPAIKFLIGTYRPPPISPTVPDPRVGTPQAVRTANALLRELPSPKGEEWARIELEIALRSAGPAEKIAIGEWYLAHNDPNRACRIGIEILSTLPCPRAYRLAYPLAFQAMTFRWAQEYNVDPYLVLAVMREESLFAPLAVSTSDARGLMQLLPSTAEWIARDKIGENFFEEDLFQPETNIRLGTWYLSYLLDMFSGDVAKAIAAYNGGPGNLSRWLSNPSYQGPEDLPAILASTETREYLVKVLNSWLVYYWLSGA